MSDCEETGVSCQPWNSPLKKKRKKNSQKDKTCVKHKNCITVETEESIQGRKKKKKKSKFKEAVEEKKKEKKGKKKKLPVVVDDMFMGYSGASGPIAESEPEMQSPRSTKKPDHLSEDSPKKTKRKKKVVFDLSPGHSRLKHPQFASSSPKEKIVTEEEAVRQGESRQVQPHNDDSQCTSDDVNSQDLFITQKTFRTSPSEPSSCEACDKAAIASPRPIARAGRGPRASGAQIKHHDAANARLQDLHVPLVLTEEDEGSHLAQSPRKEPLSFQRLMVSGPARVKPGEVNPYLNDPIVVPPSLDGAASKKGSRASGQQPPSCPLSEGEPPRTSKAIVSTQTENFFTTELCSYLNFCHNSRGPASLGNLKPLDLSLPQRAREDLGRRLPAKVSGIGIKGDGEKRSDRKPSPPPADVKANGPGRRRSCSSVVKEEACGLSRSSASARAQGKTTPSSQSESEPRSADTTTSGDDVEPPGCAGKLDLTQVRAVQTRLNESFFFKAKGAGRARRPESPLMKLAQGGEPKSRKFP